MKEYDLKNGDIYLSNYEKYLKNCGDIFLGICFFISFVIVIFSSMFFPAQVVGRSMMPTINAGIDLDINNRDFVYANNWFAYQRSDIIIVDLPELENDGIKRLIAVGGDVISFGDIDSLEEELIYLNGSILIEPYLGNAHDNVIMINRFKELIIKCLDAGDTQELKRDWLSQNTETGYWEISLPEDYCIYLGDNRAESYDCSSFGPQKMDTIYAKVYIIVPYDLNIYNYFWAMFLRLFY